MQITRKDLLSALRSRLLTKYREQLERRQAILTIAELVEPKQSKVDSADAAGAAKIKRSAAFKSLIAKLDKAKIKYEIVEEHSSTYDTAKPGERKTTIYVRVKATSFVATATPAPSLLKAIERYEAKVKPLMDRCAELRKKITKLANGEGTDILSDVLSETMVSDEPAMKAMMQRLETAVDQALRV